MVNIFGSPDEVRKSLLQNNYLIDPKVATTVFLAIKLQKPLLVEGPAGVGKTYLARALALAAGSELVRLQCYPGLDESKSLYEWNYQKQLLYLQTLKENATWEMARDGIYTHEFLLSRPILKAFLSPKSVVLLIDEIDKSDEELESFLLEALSEFQISIPELGTVRPVSVPTVIITSNNSRDFSDALKRRCLHLHIPFPGRDREEAIIRMHMKDINDTLAREISFFLARVRKMALRKQPGIAETLDWAKSLMALNVSGLDNESVRLTLNALIKYEEDIVALESGMDQIIRDCVSITPPQRSYISSDNGAVPDNYPLSRFDF